MKKIFALILIIAMLIPFVVACDGGDETTTTTEIIDYDKFTSKDTVKKDWEGETLLVAATAWSANPSYPWSTMELVIKEGETSGWGEKIDKAVLERTAYIKATYGVDVIWEWASRYNTHDVLKNAIAAGNEPDYDLAMPRNFRAQAIVANGSVYDMANRPYINFNNSYYNQDSVKTYTAKGHTFFITGDFANLDKYTAYVIFFNKSLMGREEDVNELYQLVRDGKWTWDKLVAYGNAIYMDDGDGIKSDGDIFGLVCISQYNLYECFGIKRVGTDKSTGDWIITLNAPKINDVISAIITVNTSLWASGTAVGNWWEGGTHQYLVDDGLLFCADNIYFLNSFSNHDDLGVIPFPMLNEEQGRYYVPCAAQQSTLMCVPKTTSDRNMSDYFVDVLAWTGKEYVMEAYYDRLSECLSSEADMEMIKEYIMPNITYDAARAAGWSSVFGDTVSASYKENKFEEAFAKEKNKALITLKQWNEVWGAYTE